MKKILNRIFASSKYDYFKYLDTQLAENKKIMITTVNPETIMHSKTNDVINQMLNDDRVSLVPDGIAIVKACRKYKINVKERITGVDITEYLFQISSKYNKRVFIFGSKQNVLDELKVVIKNKYPGIKIVGMVNGYVDDKEAVSALIKKKKPDVVIVALGIPNQELFIYNNLDKYDKGIFIGVGGSLDVLSGTKKRAPRIFIKTNTEWLYRILSEPKRIKRFYQNNIKFLLNIYFKGNKDE